MRRANKEIRDRTQIHDILATAQVGRLGTINQEGYPLIKPVNFVHSGEHIYLHSATAGEKIDDITRDNRVCFEVDVPVKYVKARGNPCSASYLYRSVIVTGRAEIVELPPEKIMALKKLMEKYQPEGDYGDFPEEKVAITAVIRIDIEEMTGKEDIAEPR